MTGGGRGIGFALARHLAAAYGCRVVVSGRAPRPPQDDPVLALDDAGFRRLRDDRLKAAAAERRVAEARRELAALARERELWRNLRDARESGADIDYVQQDVTDPADVRRLLAAAGDRLVGVVHNAGLDVPARLPVKNDDDVRRVLAVKVLGFLNLVAALEDSARPEFVCNVGSLTGRWGGMVGQLDYGAANEALSRLGLWAGAAGAAVSTLCWPTWDRLGMISNYEATLRYMSSLDVGEGVRLWADELLARTPGEVTFHGEVGASIVPSLLRGYPSWSRLPGIGRLRTELHLLGEPRRFAPGRAVESVVPLDPGLLPVARDFRVDGAPALPVSLVLEHLLAAGRWVLPEGREDLELLAVRELRVELPALRLMHGRTALLAKSATAKWVADEWHVEAALELDGADAARALLVLGARPAPAPPQVLPEPPGALPPAGAPTSDRLAWLGHTFRPADWRVAPDGSWHAASTPAYAADVLGATPAPLLALDLAAVEGLVRGVWARSGTPTARVLNVPRIELGPAAGPARRLHVDATGGTWAALDAAGAPVARLLAPSLHP
nr:SDR family NAD(P)-dependent oxidoreductase [Motilibacter deserti]